MGNKHSVFIDFASLLSKKQLDILELCMRHETIPWTNVLAKLFPEVKDKEYLSYLINKYKNRTNVQSQSATLNPEIPRKRKSTLISPADLKVAAAPHMGTIDACQVLFEALGF